MARSPAAPRLRALAKGVYMLPVFTKEFCSLLCEELNAFASSGLPAGKPNSMNNAGKRTAWENVGCPLRHAPSTEATL